jgi:hypothetical protein
MRYANASSKTVGIAVVAAVVVALAPFVDAVVAGQTTATLRVAQDSATAFVDECRRLALEQYTSAAAEYDSDALKDKELFDIWSKKNVDSPCRRQKSKCGICKIC